MKLYGSQSMVGPLEKVLVKRPKEAFKKQSQINHNWESLGYLVRPDFDAAVNEFSRFLSILESSGTEINLLPKDNRTGLDSIYTHDPVAAVTNYGVILGSMGKNARKEEPQVQEAWYKEAGIPIIGKINYPGTIEGGDVVWLRENMVAIGLTYRTNKEGIKQFQSIVKPHGVEVLPVPMIHWDGPDAVLHLMSIISMLDTDLAVVYERLLPIPFRSQLIDLAINLVNVPDQEYETLGCNVLAVKPRNVLIRNGNPITVERMRLLGCTVHEFFGDHICYPGSGGPTCLTRPICRKY